MPVKAKKVSAPKISGTAATTKSAKAKTKPAVKKTAKPKGRKPKTSRAAKSDSGAATLKKIRQFQTIGQKRVGMLFSGGPAPGANAVISTAAIQFLNDGYDVIGFFKGYEFLEKFDRENPKAFQEGIHYKSLTYDDITKIRQRGGSILRTARANPSRTGDREIKSFTDLADPKLNKKLYNVIDALEYIGVSSLISIGGDDTLKTAYYLSLLGVPTVHVPKTIDNDYFGIPWTFGYFSAIERARQDIKVYNNEVRTTDCYFVLELMGRKAGWYTLGAGIAGEAVRMIGPEEVEDKLDMDALASDLVNLIIKREESNKHYGVILVSEGLADKLPKDKANTQTDQHGNIRLSELKIGEIIAVSVKKAYKKLTGRSLTIKNETIGYTTRCVEPSAFDILLGSQLGMGAYRFVKEKRFSHMVSVGDNLEIRKESFQDLIDPDTFKTRLRFVPMDGDFYKLAKSLEFRAVRRDIKDFGLL